MVFLFAHGGDENEMNKSPLHYVHTEQLMHLIWCFFVVSHTTPTQLFTQPKLICEKVNVINQAKQFRYDEINKFV